MPVVSDVLCRPLLSWREIALGRYRHAAEYTPQNGKPYNKKHLFNLTEYQKILAGAHVWWEDKKMAPGVEARRGRDQGNVVEQESPSLIRES